MSIEIIDILKPKNGLSFKLIEDIDIAVQGYTSLADAVSHFVTTESIQQIINAALSGKQDTLSSAQLEACNSGITSELVAQISLNTTAIAGKADSTDLTTATTNLQAQIDNIVSGSTADSEVINARVGVDGNNYATLKSRLDAEENATNKMLGSFTNITSQLIEHYYIPTTDPIDVTDRNYQTDWTCGVFDCAEGDIFRVVGTGGVSYRMWTFIDTDGHVLTQAAEMPDYTVSHDYKIVAPANAVKLVVNFRTVSVSCSAYKFSYRFADKAEYQQDLAVVNNKVGMLIHNKKTMYTDVGLTAGYFVKSDTGELSPNASYYASDYIDVSNMDSIILYQANQSAYYNAQKVYMGNFGNITETLMEETTFAIPEGAKYIRCSVYETRINTAYYISHDKTSSFDDDYVLSFRMSDIENDAGYVKNNIFYVGSTREITTLRAGIAEAIKVPNSTVYVDAGVYDLTTEFAAEIQAAGEAQYGIRLKNGVHVIFSSGAKVIAKYTGGDTNVETYFAPFYADNQHGVVSNFVLENLDIESENTRYCVHDECGGSSGAYTHRYINCKMSNDNVDSAIGKGYYPQCIGGGLGQYGYIDIEGCYFKTKRAETERTTCVSYHNNYYANSKSNINVRDCYFDDYGTFRVTHYGSSTDVSQAIICNCSLGLAPYIEHEQGSQGPENMNLRAYLNDVRNSEPPAQT